MKERNIIVCILMAVWLASTAYSSVIDLGQAANFAILGTENTKVKLDKATVNGNVGVGSGGEFEFKSYSVTGDIYMDAGATIDTFDGTHSGTLFVGQDLRQALTDAYQASLTAGQLEATQTFNEKINSSQTIIGNGGVNVINMNGVDLGTGEVISLSGGASDFFILNILEGNAIKLGKSSSAIRGVGVGASQILINVLGTADKMKGEIDGTILAIGETVTLQGILNGAIIAGGVMLGSDILDLEVQATINNMPMQTIPEPSTIIMLGMGSLVLLRMRKIHP